MLAAGSSTGLLGACFDGKFLAGRPCEDDDDCGPSLRCNTNGFCGDVVDDLCGNGLVDTNEECDDGNEFDGDNCTNACTVARCGDGVVGPGEGCDDANEDDTDACTNACKSPVCGDGVVSPSEGEICDDANTDETDDCTTKCAPPSCDDGILSGAEIGVDCGRDACDVGCPVGDPCMLDSDCIDSVCAPTQDNTGNLACRYPVSCAEYLSFVADSSDGLLTIDLDGVAGDPAFEVYCDMSRSGGGWTLVFVSSDDDQDTWTWANRAALATEPDLVGDASALNRDYMNAAYHLLPLTDAMFVHQPSGTWAAYADIGPGDGSFAELVAGFFSPLCDLSLVGEGFPLTDGTLELGGDLCDTDLYFNLGSHAAGVFNCEDITSLDNSATFGPVWHGDEGLEDCEFVTPAEFGLGPHGPCENCSPSIALTELPVLGFANALDLNDIAPGAGTNYMQLYVR